LHVVPIKGCCNGYGDQIVLVTTGQLSRHRHPGGYPAEMRTLMFIAGGAAFGAGVSVTLTLKGGVQGEMAATCFIGAAILFGLSAVLSGQHKIIALLQSRGVSDS
jgi:hypothetical protein